MGTPADDLGRFLQETGSLPGWHIVYVPVAGSTMDLAREAARHGGEGRSVFVCDYQTAGRGRLGRRWEAPPGLALLFTVLLRGEGPPQHSTMLVSVAVAEAIEQQTALRPAIKWPNDLMLDGGKVAGVLAEAYSGPPAGYVLVGCGVNVNQTAEDLAALGRAAASLRQVCGRPIHRGELLISCLRRLDHWLRWDVTTRVDALRAAWESRLWRRGALVRLREADATYNAWIEGVVGDGALLVRLENGERRRVVAGEILL